MDVYQGLGDIPKGSIKHLRIIQIFPKTTPWANDPAMGIALEENGRAVLGTVPVESDGSARFTVPAQKPLLLQALDENGFAYQTMRSVVYVQSGEQISCAGCHENRLSAPRSARALALRREPSQITPGPRDGRPFSYAETVQPVLDRHCLACHSGAEPPKGLDLTGTPEGHFTRSYNALCRDFKRIPHFKMRNQIQVTPVGGTYGALGSGLIKMLQQGHNKVELSPDEIRRLATWIDLNAIFYGSPDPATHQRQRYGQAVAMPEIQ
jgi:hypothetical protein